MDGSDTGLERMEVNTRGLLPPVVISGLLVTTVTMVNHFLAICHERVRAF